MSQLGFLTSDLGIKPFDAKNVNLFSFFLWEKLLIHEQKKWSQTKIEEGRQGVRKCKQRIRERERI